jgi:hypothetical protein
VCTSADGSQEGGSRWLPVACANVCCASLTPPVLCCAALQEMSLDEYEKLLAEKKEALNKKGAVGSVDPEQFAGMKALSKTPVQVDEDPLQLSNKKEAKTIKSKSLKEVRAARPLLRACCKLWPAVIV